MQREDKQVLGRETREPIEAEQLDTVPWNHTDTDTVIEFSTSELTALCPITAQPDFYELELSYRPGALLLESKSMKLYLWGFRDRGVFAEDMAATLLQDAIESHDLPHRLVEVVSRRCSAAQLHDAVFYGAYL